MIGWLRNILGCPACAVYRAEREASAIRERDLLARLTSLVDARAQAMVARTESSERAARASDPLTPGGAPPVLHSRPRPSLRLPALAQTLVGGGHLNLDRARADMLAHSIAKGRTDPAAS